MLSLNLYWFRVLNELEYQTRAMSEKWAELQFKFFSFKFESGFILSSSQISNSSRTSISNFNFESSLVKIQFDSTHYHLYSWCSSSSCSFFKRYSTFVPIWWRLANFTIYLLEWCYLVKRFWIWVILGVKMKSFEFLKF